MKTNGFIKLHRSILDWRWYKDANTFRVFLHLLLKAAISDYEYKNIKIRRGEVLTTYGELANEISSNSLSVSERQVRTAVEHLKSTGEVSITRLSKNLIISIVNYNNYQASPSIKSQSDVNQKSIKSQSQKNKNNKNNKNIYNNACTRERENSFPTPKPTKFSNFEQNSNIDYKEFEMTALRKRMERGKKNAEETNPQL